jgi:RNase H-fold protein (predicted Holliday junction resolvase)
MVAFPRGGYRRRSLIEDRMELKRLLEVENLCGMVVGMPSAPSGHECHALRDFVQAYSEALLKDAPFEAIVLADESYSTLLARERVNESTKRSVLRDLPSRKRAVDAVRRPELPSPEHFR